jgi:hypothetical protein
LTATDCDVLVLGAGAAGLAAGAAHAPTFRPDGGYTALLTALAGALDPALVRMLSQWDRAARSGAVGARRGSARAEGARRARGDVRRRSLA